MDPNPAKSASKDGKWEFPEGLEFPVDARVVVKLYKVAEVAGPEGTGAQSKYLNTKVLKVEVSLEKEDLLAKSSLLAAIERDCEIKQIAEEEGIQNPKSEVSIKRQDSSKVFTVTKMGFVVKRLGKLKNRSDTILVEVKEQIVSFQPNKPVIKIVVNGVAQDGGGVKGRTLAEYIVKGLNEALQECDDSSYNKESKRIICGKCSAGTKIRNRGGVKTIVKYFQDHHFSKCGNRDKKRKAKEDLEESLKEKKRKETEKMDKYWGSLMNKAADVEENSDEDFDDPDLVAEDDINIGGSSFNQSTKG